MAEGLRPGLVGTVALGFLLVPHFGLMGAAGAALSTMLGGLIAEEAGTDLALLALAGCGVACVAVAGLLVPETREARAAGRAQPLRPATSASTGSR